MFPKTNESTYIPASSHEPYLATTFNINGSRGSHGNIIRAINAKLPVAFTDGAATYSEHHPELESKVAGRVLAYNNIPIINETACFMPSLRLRAQRGRKQSSVLKSHWIATPLASLGFATTAGVGTRILNDMGYRSSPLRFANTLSVQRIFYGYAPQNAYYSNDSLTHNPGNNRANTNIDIACSYHAVRNDVQYIEREFGWTRNRLPLVRQLNSNTTIYLGMELTSNNTTEENKKIRFEGWVKTALRQFFPQELIDGLSIRQGSAFTVQMRTCNKIMHQYPDTHVQVFNLGDALATPHFLTGSGLESAAISVHHWIEYMRHGNQAEYIQKIKDEVQARSLDKVNDGLGQLSMFAPTTPDALLQAHSEPVPTVPTSATSCSSQPPQSSV